MHAPRLLPLVLPLALALAAPAAAAQQQDTAPAVVAPPADTTPAQPARQQRVRRDRNRLTMEEIRAGNQGNMLEVIRARRPHWLRRNNPDRSRHDSSEKVALFVNGTDQTGDRELNEFLPTQIVRAQYVSATDATVLHGPRYSKGIIMLFTH